jgi:parallel beta-helix repeat protein
VPQQKKKEKKNSWKERLRERRIRYQKTLEAHRTQMEKVQKKTRRWPKGKILTTICLFILLFAVYSILQQTESPSTPNSNNQQQNTTPIEIAEAVYIRRDGSISPSTAPISVHNGYYYTLKADIYMPIVVRKDNVLIDGAGYTIKGTRIYGSKGIDLTNRINVTVKNVNIEGFDYGIYLNSTSNSIILQNNLTNNYIGVWIGYSTNNKIESNVITNTTLSQGYGIWLKNSSQNIVLKNEITFYTYALFIGFSDENMLSENCLVNNLIGAFFSSSFNNKFYANNVSINRNGIHLLQSKNNTIYLNDVANNALAGISSDKSSNNIIYNNNFINNNVQVYSVESANFWDNGYNTGGNYWSDYEEKYPDAERLEESGVWNKPYIIDENNSDRYPLISPKH